MRFLADENFSDPVVDRLIASGHDVLRARDVLQGEDDADLLSLAQTDDRIVLTCDKDFGTLVFQRGLPAQSGVLLFRVDLATPEAEEDRIVSIILSRSDWPGHFSVISNDSIRMRRLTP